MARMSSQAIFRRSANYQPSVWKDEFIQSLTSKFMEGRTTYIGRFNELKKEVRVIMSRIIDDPLKQLELIDTIQRLGISYHFECEIKEILVRIYKNSYEDDTWRKKNLYATALEFRLLRKHGFNISQDVFYNFMAELGSFSTCLYDNTNGMLSLYEASFLSMEGETVLEAARCFTINYLEKYIRSREDEFDVAIVQHALEHPLHWITPRMEARWFIDIYERKANMNPILLEIAKLDFNIVQSIHQEDLKNVSSWWQKNELGEKLSFTRDRLMVHFFWSIGIQFEPNFKNFRRMITKVGALVTIIDDIYDVYGTLDELELFMNFVERWDVNTIDELPDYMKVCFLALHTFIHEMTFEAARDQEVNIIQYVKKAWVDLCKSYMVEAKWYHSGYKPTLQQYFDNAWISISGPVLLVHAYVSVTSPVIKEELESLLEYNDIIYWSSTILRLANDLGTSWDEQKRGDVPKSIQCYMNDNGVSEGNAREYIKQLIDETWKKLNKVEIENSIFSQVFIEIAKNLARTAQCVYQYGDGHGIENQKTKDGVVSLLIQPIPIQE